MTLLPPSHTTRKRSRSCEEEDFLPLSKKINNLHINNWGKIHPPQDELLKWNNSPEQYLSYYAENILHGRQENNSSNTSPLKREQKDLQNYYDESELSQHFKHMNNEPFKTNSYPQEKCTNGESSSSNSNRVVNDWSTVYNPDLDVNENPYYYESNKLLFGLYIERLQRTGY